MSPKGQGPLPFACTLKSLKTLPRPVYGHVESLPNQVLSYRHRHCWGQLAYAAHGVLEVHTDTGRFVAPPQRAVWIPPGIDHRVCCGTKTCIRSLYIDRCIPGWSADRCRVIVVSPLLRELIRTFSTMPVEYEEHSAEERFVEVLLDQLAQAPEVELMLPLPSDRRLRRLCRNLQTHPERQSSLAEWSHRFGVSNKTLSRLFLRETGLTFRGWRQRMRLLSALPALERGDRVTDVALACGYESLSAFIAAFREQFGRTPGEFLRSK